jgi:transcriptional regulator with XRE-family HTH domain
MSTDPGLQPGRSPRTAPSRPRGEPGGGRRAAAAVGRRPPGTRPPGQPGLVRPRPPAPGLGRRRLGRELRLLREARSLRLADVADRLGVAPSTLSRIESGKAPTRTGYLALMLDLYDVADPGQRAGLTDLARQGRRDGWWTDYSDVLPAAARHWLSLEAAATSLRGYCLQTVPDLLQVPGYTTATLKAAQPGLDPGQVGRLAVVTQRRQHGLLDGGCQVHLLVDESALVRAVAGAGVMTGQLQQVLDLAARPAVTVQVVAMTTPQVVLSRPFTVLGFPDPADGDVVSYGGEGGPVTVSRGAGDAREALDTFGALARAALSPADSAEFIAGLIRAT